MAKVDGVYDCLTKTPMGDQQSVLTIVSDGDRFNGTNSNALGSLDITDGKVDGNLLTWKMEMKVPMPMVLDAEAIVDGDKITGTIQLGAFGSAAMTGTRRG